MTKRPANGYWELARNREFSGMWLAQGFSTLGDQLARIALAIALYGETHSAFVSGLSFAASYAPWLLGPWITTLADSQPRKRVMVGSDLIRALFLTAIIALIRHPVAVIALTFIEGIAAVPFRPARSALVADIVGKNRVRNAVSAQFLTSQVMLFGGYILGGALIAFFGAQNTLFIDVISFLFSAAFVGFFVRHRQQEVGTQNVHAALREALIFIRANKNVRNPILLAGVDGLWMVPFAMAVVITGSRHPHATGWLLASIPIGITIGVIIMMRGSKTFHHRSMYPFAIAAGALLMASAIHMSLLALMILWGIAGIGMAAHLPANIGVVLATPTHLRGRVVGVAQSFMSISQTLCTLIAGYFATMIPATIVVSVSGAIACVVALLIGINAMRHQAAHPPTSPPKVACVAALP